MSFLKKLSLAVLTIAFCLGLFAVTSNAQWSRRDRSWQNSSSYWQTQQYRRNRRWQNRNYISYYGYGRVTPQEYRRLQQQRYRLYNQRNRAYSDGYVSDKERRKLQKRYNKYRRNVYRDRRDW